MGFQTGSRQRPGELRGVLGLDQNLIPLATSQALQRSRSRTEHHHFTGRHTFQTACSAAQMMGDPFYWNALYNMVIYVAMILVEYAIAFGLALLLNAEIRARKFWRVVL